MNNHLKVFQDVLKTTWKCNYPGKHDPSNLSEIVNFKVRDQEFTKIGHMKIISAVSWNQ